MEQEAQQFIEELEKRFGGKVGYRTYSTWFASDEGLLREFGVFVYEINGTFHYEDFERKPSIFGFSLRPRKNQPPYVKMEGSFTKEMVKSTSVVTKSQALLCAERSKPSEDIPPANKFQKLFSALVTKVVLTDGRTLFFELINHKAFAALIEETLDGSV